MKPSLIQSKGFTLIETMVAIFVLTLVIAVAMTGIQKSVQSSNFSRDQITAYYLAEEAIEYVRFLRDSNFKSGANWTENLNRCVNDNCRVDAVNGDSDSTYHGLRPCGGSTGQTCVLNYFKPPNTVGLYEHTNGEPSRFTRYIRVTENSGGAEGDEITVTATVTWTASPFSSQTYTIKEQLYNIEK